MSGERRIDVRVPVLARVEGEGALELAARDGRIETLKLRIFEPPRLFEKFLEGRDCRELPDLVARICGICPAAYQMSAVQALESLFGVVPGPWVQAMRRAMYCGEWIESHALHIHLLAAPDFLGYPSAIAMAKDHPEVVRRGLRLQALGNDLIRLFGGRSVHPVGLCIGGFHRAPTAEEVAAVRVRLAEARGEAEELLAWTARLPLPESDQDFIGVALRHPDEYPMYSGRIAASDGFETDVAGFESGFREFQVPHSTALHSLYRDRPYLVGPLARLHLNRERLPPPVEAAVQATGIEFPTRNMYHSIVARAAELLLAVHEAVRLLADYAPALQPCAPFAPRAGIGFGASEAPRGLLWHRYEVDADGRIRAARIVPPTSQNQARIEEDLRRSLEEYGLGHSDAELRLRAETVIRNYDPCISCATHFLDLRVKRT